MFCLYCGTEIRGAGQFCPHCGQKAVSVRKETVFAGGVPVRVVFYADKKAYDAFHRNQGADSAGEGRK